MDTEGHWEPLNLNLGGLPRLLVRYMIRDAGYTVSITDLVNLWTENLSKPQIIENAIRQSCSINPGDDAGQLKILLEKIRHILRHGPGTSVRIGLDAPDNLTLALSAPLPFPLPPFEWTVTLARATSAELAEQVITPLLLLAHRQQHQLQYLLGQLRDKDHVLARLLDKMESTNTDLGSVFPGLSAGRNSQRSLKRSQVTKHVRGLAPFQPGSELQHSGGIPSENALYGVLRDVRDDNSNVLPKPTSDAWWQDIARQRESISVSTLVPADVEGDETDDDLDFQTQTIPDHLQRQRPADISSPARPSHLVRKFTPIDDASTDNDGVTSSPPPLPQNPPRFETETPAPDSPSKHSYAQPRRIGAVGGRSSSQLPLPVSPPMQQAESHVSRTRARVSSTPPPALPPQSQATPSRTRRLGGIGRGSSQMQPSLNRWSSQALPTLEEEISKPNLNLGASDQAIHEGSKDESRQTRAAKRKASEEKEPSPRETSVERADRKRQELKQNMNEKNKMPVKRKRRF